MVCGTFAEEHREIHVSFDSGRYDAVVIGAGFAGCIAARDLTDVGASLVAPMLCGRSFISQPMARVGTLRASSNRDRSQPIHAPLRRRRVGLNRRHVSAPSVECVGERPDAACVSMRGRSEARDGVIDHARGFALHSYEY